MYGIEKASLIKHRNKTLRRNFDVAAPWRHRPSGQSGISGVPASNLLSDTDLLKDFVRFPSAYSKRTTHNHKLSNHRSFLRSFRVIFTNYFNNPRHVVRPTDSFAKSTITNTNWETLKLLQCVTTPEHNYKCKLRDPQTPAHSPTVVFGMVLLCCHWLLAYTVFCVFTLKYCVRLPRMV